MGCDRTKTAEADRQDAQDDVDIVIKMDNTSSTVNAIAIVIPCTLALCFLVLIYTVVQFKRKGTPRHILYCKRSMQEWVWSLPAKAMWNFNKRVVTLKPSNGTLDHGWFSQSCLFWARVEVIKERGESFHNTRIYHLYSSPFAFLWCIIPYRSFNPQAWCPRGMWLHVKQMEKPRRRKKQTSRVVLVTWPLPCFSGTGGVFENPFSTVT